MDLGKNWPFFHLYISGNIGQQNICYDSLERKSTFIGFKNKKCKKSKEFKNIKKKKSENTVKAGEREEGGKDFSRDLTESMTRERRKNSGGNTSIYLLNPDTAL